MKKSIFSALVLATSLVACTGDYTDWAQPQSNPQPATIAFGNGSVTEVGLIDFADEAVASSENVKICGITAPTSTDASYSNTIYVLNLGETAYEFTSEGTMKTADLKAYVETNFGKAPEEREVSATVSQWINNGTTTIKTAAASFTVKVKLDAPVLYDHLYLIGAPSEWSPICTTMPFTRDESKSVYDAPEFTVMFPVEDGDTWFAFADDKTVETNEWSNVFGCREGNGQNLVGERGTFTRRADLSDDGSFMVSVNGDAKFIKVTVNMLDGWYLIEKVNFEEYLYVPGNAQGWDPSTAAGLHHEGDGQYTGFAYLDGGFKLSKARDWDHGDYGQEAFTTAPEGFEVGGSGDIKCNVPGVYYLDVNVATGEFNATLVEKMGVIGGFNDWADDLLMTWNAADLCYEVTGATVTEAGWKFRINADWGVNLGGELTNLVKDGANLTAVGATIKLYPCRTTSDNIYATVE